MQVGVVKEVKDHEYRVGATPGMVRSMQEAGAQVLVESGAGLAIGYSDEQYQSCGAQIVTCEQAWQADLVIKVKEPLLFEVERMKEGKSLYAFLHLAAEKELTLALIKKKITAIAFETITSPDGRLPLLSPMSAIAGRIAAQMGALGLHKTQGGLGKLLGGIPGVLPAQAVVIGAGVSGAHAIASLIGMGADVTVLDTNLIKLEQIQKHWGARVKTLYSTKQALATQLLKADLVVIGVLVTGDKAPKLITRAMLKSMQKGAVIVDISIDQGGACETSRPTTHSNPFYIEDGIVHYCVSNIPGTCAKTATEALSSVTLSHALSMISMGVQKAIDSDKHLRDGVNVHAGKITHRAIAQALKMEYDKAFNS